MQLHNGPSSFLYGRQANSGHNHYITVMRYLKSWSNEVLSTFSSKLKINSALAKAEAAAGKSCCRQIWSWCQDISLSILWPGVFLSKWVLGNVHVAGRRDMTPTEHCLKYSYVCSRKVELFLKVWLYSWHSQLTNLQCIGEKWRL